MGVSRGWVAVGGVDVNDAADVDASGGASVGGVERVGDWVGLVEFRDGWRVMAGVCVDETAMGVGVELDGLLKKSKSRSDRESDRAPLPSSWSPSPGTERPGGPCPGRLSGAFDDDSSFSQYKGSSSCWRSSSRRPRRFLSEASLASFPNLSKKLILVFLE